MIAHDMIIRPIISEKTMAGSAMRKYTFKVAQGANKIEIKKAVEEVFGVKVAKVNVMHVLGKLRRRGKTKGYTPSWKKAIVTLTQDSKNIEFFENMV